MTTNPFKPQHGIFTLPNELLRSQGKRPFIFGPNQWCDLTVWIASETIKPSTFDWDALLNNCGHENLEIRNMAMREWSRRIGCALIKKQAYSQFMAGEEQYNGPKICEKTHKTILKVDLTRIILEHRAKVREWYKKKKEQQQQQKDKQRQQKEQQQKEQQQQERAVLDKVPELIIEDHGDLDNWEEIDV